MKNMPGAEAVDRFAEMQIAEHLQPGEADVHAVEVGDHVAEHQKRKQPPGDFGVDAVVVLE